MRGGPVVVGSAGIEKLAAGAGDLPGRVRDVLAKVTRKGIRELFERDLGPAGRRDLQEGLREGKFVGRDIAPEKNDGTPIGLKGRVRLLK